MPNVELIYVPKSGETFHKRLELFTGATISDVLMASGVFDVYPEAHGMQCGVFSTLVAHDTLVQEGDRIEIYRPLVADPKIKRRNIARRNSKNGDR